MLILFLLLMLQCVLVWSSLSTEFDEWSDKLGRAAHHSLSLGLPSKGDGKADWTGAGRGIFITRHLDGATVPSSQPRTALAEPLPVLAVPREVILTSADVTASSLSNVTAQWHPAQRQFAALSHLSSALHDPASDHPFVTVSRSVGPRPPTPCTTVAHERALWARLFEWDRRASQQLRHHWRQLDEAGTSRRQRHRACQGLARAVQCGNQLCFAPLIDLVNHAPAAAGTSNRHRSANSMLTVYPNAVVLSLTHQVARGDELLLAYTPLRESGAIWMTAGFVPADRGIELIMRGGESNEVPLVERQALVPDRDDASTTTELGGGASVLPDLVVEENADCRPWNATTASVRAHCARALAKLPRSLSLPRAGLSVPQALNILGVKLDHLSAAYARKPSPRTAADIGRLREQQFLHRYLDERRTIYDRCVRHFSCSR